MPPAFFDLIKKYIHHHIRKSVTNFRKPLAVGLKLAITLTHLATGETYTSLQYHWLVGRTTNSRTNIWTALLTLKTGKRVGEKFRNRWNVPYAVEAIHEKHIAMKKPKKSGSDYYNYKGFFSLGLLALVGTEYKFLWVNVG